MPSTLFRGAKRRLTLKPRYARATSATKGMSEDNRTTSNEPSRKRWRLRNDVPAVKKGALYGKKHNRCRERKLARAGAAPGHGIAEHPGNSIHLTLQGKGGVGKSFIASILAQYFADRRREIICIDTDPVNRTLFQLQRVECGQSSRTAPRSGPRLDPRVFDDLMGRLITEDATFVVDNGASTFIPLWNYILRNKALDSLARKGRKVYVHTVVTGGQSLLDTLHGFKSLAETTSERNIIVWLYEYLGIFERYGKRFGEMTAFLDSEAKVF